VDFGVSERDARTPKIRSNLFRIAIVLKKYSVSHSYEVQFLIPHSHPPFPKTLNYVPYQYEKCYKLNLVFLLINQNIMVQQEIEALLRQKIGLDSSTIGTTKIARAIESRRIACQLSDIINYFQFLKTSPQELEELIENVVIPETWFFRDQKPFIFLSRYILSEWLAKFNPGILRILSVPCCTGEEPFSIAMTLLDAGLSPNQFSIDAVDISKQALNKARKGIYGNNSFRGELQSYQKRFFKPIDQQYQLNDTVRNTVNFKQANILEPFFLKNKQYEIIFCRNLLIYLDQESRNRAVDVLEKLLTINGLLFVGSAETAIVNRSNLTSMREAFTFAYKKIPPNQIVPPKQPLTIQPNQIPKFQPNLTPKFPALPLPKNLNQKQLPLSLTVTSVTPKSAPLPNPNLTLNDARNLANQGKLTEAAELCETYLKQNNTNPEAYVLLGEIQQSLKNNDQAEQCYQKALYLNPSHYEALMHLALLKEHRGDQKGAAIMRQRLQRVLKSQSQSK
jgi:chemotaxis protein methyltransferase WspC